MPIDPILICFGAAWVAMIVALAIEMEPAFKDAALEDEDLKPIWSGYSGMVA
jgi:hypothetical protein